MEMKESFEVEKRIVDEEMANDTGELSKALATRTYFLLFGHRFARKKWKNGRQKKVDLRKKNKYVK